VKRLILLLVLIFMAITVISLNQVQTIEAADDSKIDLYTVGVNDVININVLDRRELSIQAIVGADGSITYPYIGSLFVKDMTLLEIKDEITKRLAEGYVTYPVVTVSLSKADIKKIYIYGEFVRRGAVPYEKDMTVLMAISLGGGASGDGLYGVLKVKRRQKRNLKYDVIIHTDINNGDIRDKKIENMLLEPDDILIIERNKTFLVQGEFAKRGRFVLEKDMTVLRALLETGGVSPDGFHGKLKVRRKQEDLAGGYKDVAESKINEGIIESTEVEDLILQPDDILIVERSKTFLVQGEFAKRGRFVLEKDMTVLRALLEAGGVSTDGFHGKLKVRRKQEGLVGGYKDVAESKINEGIFESKDVEDIILQPDDILIVERNKTYFMYGEVNKIGEYVFKRDITVFEAITVAGGFTKWGAKSKVKILRKNKDNNSFEIINVNIGKVIDGDAGADVQVKPDDTIVVSSAIF
jgi:polysaccharide export outer membrane protein